MIDAIERRGIIAAAVREVLRRVTGHVPALRWGTVLSDESTDEGELFRVILDGDELGNDIACVSATAGVAEDDRVLVAWNPPHETIIVGVRQ
ncbi:hypothetical protein [Nitrosomonas sp.]|uniref:hypothetical protein n=1 Tax=Nitrosomonas sp. TaxID=42353 RepID=UPI0026005D06|nr:hypothetical protein [Nitrosomonas sp.]MBV6448510.1 hypothetical protein [Nitrosomonas sp.]